ncbi:Pimeloyl-ACP methyl ester carboxylesterase [Bartonella sp. CDC_skunk]|uniref:alpha/beta fold hydrolase n=1 Tax=unclassified Bartonella TaxID=2645622 RepID=UPI00099973E5|nr:MULTISPECIES: alpha/beta hydrolase [unclassified Bartonella]AQX21328.1 Pimeloyl-ACP methyl ester carboxylesterase [Bartonella sp. CDC_skunk]AQX26586.1 Pimeloyl-ACP methyl ester carboxylesterase [Bartonella sp. Raccoon60]
MTAEEIRFFEHDGLRFAYCEEGQGAPILLIHGFGSSARINWYATGWFRTLIAAGYRVIAFDNRGHGDSDKIYDPLFYTPQAMASDAVKLLQHLELSKAHVMGYSMGARISAFMALLYPTYVHSVILGGLGIGMVTGAGDWEPVAQALLEKDVSAITDPRGLMFRKFAEQTKSDRRALAACIMTSKQELTEHEIYKIKQPALVAVGSLDEISGEAEPLVALLPHGEALQIPGRDHMLAVGDKVYKKGVIDFLARHPIV